MTKGISTACRVTSKVDCLCKANIEFVFRYYSRTTQIAGKRITKAEARALNVAGIQIGVFYQDRARQDVDFAVDRGRQDGESAVKYAKALGQPEDTAIYFAVDTDFGPIKVENLIIPYFAAVNEGMLNAATGNNPYKIGVYGSGLVISKVKAHWEFVRYGCLAEAPGWHGTAGFAGWTVKQILDNTPLCGLKGDDYEPCQANGDFGGFMLQNGR